jgi:hypothetical protein
MRISVGLLTAACLAQAGTALCLGQASNPPTPAASVSPSNSGSTTSRPAQLGVVKVDRAYVYCGPSKEHYPTDVLSQGQQVRVYFRRADGWLAIEPPPGSHGWVNADYVRLVADGIGEATVDGVPVWIGSNVSPRRDYAQVRLRRGDRVRILRRHVFPEDPLRWTWYQVEPPAGEYRWVPADAIEPIQGSGFPTESPVGAGPGPTPSHHDRGPLQDIAPGTNATQASSPVPALEVDTVQEVKEPHPGDASKRPSGSTRGEGKTPHEETLALQLFEQAEQEFAQTMQLPVGRRDILRLKAWYEQILQMTGNPAVVRIARQRIAYLEQEEVRERMAQKFLSLLEASREKDRRLLEKEPLGASPSEARPSSRLTPAVPPPSPGGSGSLPVVSETSPGLADTSPAPQGASLGPGEAMPKEPLQPPNSPPSSPHVPAVGEGYRSLVGILQPSTRLPDGRVGYLLRSESGGQVLAYLLPAPGLNLAPYAWKRVRVTGRALAGPEAGVERLLVRRVEPMVLR